jgi:hypothetical protein
MKYVAFRLPDGEDLVAEVHEPPAAAGEYEAARPKDLADKAGRSLVEALGKLQPIAAAVRDTAAAIADVSEVSVEFAVKLSGSTGLVLATVGAEANFKVALKWSRPPAPKPAA